MYMVIISNMEIKLHIINSCLKYCMHTLVEFDLNDLNTNLQSAMFATCSY